MLGLSDLSALDFEVGEQEAEKPMPVEQQTESKAKLPIRPLTHAPSVHAPAPATAEAHAVAQAAYGTGQIRQDIFSLTEGLVTIEWPSSLSAESYQDVSDWLDIVKRKIGRSVSDALHLRDSTQAKLSSE